MPQPIRGKSGNLCWQSAQKTNLIQSIWYLLLVKFHQNQFSCLQLHKVIKTFTYCDLDLWPPKSIGFNFSSWEKICAKQDQNALNSLITIIVFTRLFPLASIAMIRRYPPNPRGTKNVFSDIRVLSIQIYVLSLLFSHGNKSRAGQGALWLE